MKKRIMCHCCGREIHVESGIPKQDYLYIKKEWGYFSKKDGKMQEFNLCEECYDDIISRFRIPVTTTDITEYM